MNVEIEIPSESGFLDIIQGVLGDPTPVSVAVPDKTLVPATTDVSAIVAADYFSDTTDVTVKVIDAQKITDADAKTIAENLSAYPEELTLTVAPDSDADLTSAAVRRHDRHHVRGCRGRKPNDYAHLRGRVENHGTDDETPCGRNGYRSRVDGLGCR